MKRWILCLILVMGLAPFNNLGAVASTVQDGDLVLSRNDLFKSSFVVGKISYDLRAQADVSVFDLIKDIYSTKGESAESIHAKIDAQRQKLYPNKEIILTITIPKPANGGTTPATSLVKAIYWWNNVNAANNYWWAQYTSTVATMFISDVWYGKYKIYDKVGTGSWIYKISVSKGGTATRYTYGPLQTRGFKGVASGVASRADVVMYFFK